MIASIKPNSCADRKDILLTSAIHAESGRRNGIYALIFRYVLFVKAIGSEAIN